MDFRRSLTTNKTGAGESIVPATEKSEKEKKKEAEKRKKKRRNQRGEGRKGARETGKRTEKEYTVSSNRARVIIRATVRFRAKTRHRRLNLAKSDGQLRISLRKHVCTAFASRRRRANYAFPMRKRVIAAKKSEIRRATMRSPAETRFHSPRKNCRGNNVYP